MQGCPVPDTAGVAFALTPLFVRILTLIGVGQPWNFWRGEIHGFFSLSFSSLWQTKPRITTALLTTISEKGSSQLEVIMVAWCSLCMLQKDIFSCRKVHYCSCRRCWNTDISWFSWLLHCVFMHHSCAMLFHPKDLYTMHIYQFFFFSLMSSLLSLLWFTRAAQMRTMWLFGIGAWSYLHNLDCFFPDQMRWVEGSGAVVLEVAVTGLSLPPTSLQSSPPLSFIDLFSVLCFWKGVCQVKGCGHMCDTIKM